MAAIEARTTQEYPDPLESPTTAMPSLPGLLATLYNAHRNVDAMTVEIRDRSQPQASDVLVVRPLPNGGIHARWMGGGPYARPIVTTRLLWFQAPDRLRVEVFDGGVAVRAAVRNGSAWWRWDQEGGESAGDLAHGAALPPLLNLTLLEPARLLPTIWFEVTGTGHRASRRVVTATGTLRHTPSGPENRREFEFDLEHGTPLHIATFEASDCVSSTEILSVDYAATINPATFTFEKLEPSESRQPGWL